MLEGFEVIRHTASDALDRLQVRLRSIASDEDLRGCAFLGFTKDGWHIGAYTNNSTCGVWKRLPMLGGAPGALIAKSSVQLAGVVEH